MVFGDQKQEKNRAKAEWPVAKSFGSVVEKEALSNTPVGPWRGEFIFIDFGLFLIDFHRFVLIFINARRFFMDFRRCTHFLWILHQFFFQPLAQPSPAQRPSSVQPSPPSPAQPPARSSSAQP